jgi:uncharacterized protein YcbX
MHISSLHTYPIKGCRGHSVTAAALDAIGFVGDRRLMLIDASGRFVSQREEPLLATIEPALDGTRLTARAPHAKVFAMEIDPGGAEVDVTVWDSDFRAVDQGDRAAEWFSGMIGTALRLVWFGPSSSRPIDPSHSPRSEAQTAFTDGYPALIVQEASLADLNARLAEPVPMGRFRPNIVVAGGTAWGEDDWKVVTAGSVTFDAVKPCARCLVPTTDQQSGARHPRQEPLRTLATFRTIRGLGAIFGMNLVARAPGQLAVGDPVTVA